MHRAWFRGLGAALTLALLMLAAPAQAHDYLVGSTPEQGTTLEAPPAQVTLEFNTSIGQKFAQVAVVGPGGTAFQSGAPSVDGAVVTQAVDAIPPGSEVTISYRVVSSDGHPIGGTVPFTVAPGAAGDAVAGPAAPAATTEADDPQPMPEAGATATTAQDDVTPAATRTDTAGTSSGGSLLAWLGLLFVGAATIAGLATFALARRRRTVAASDAAEAP